MLEGQGADELLGGYPERYSRAYLRSELDQLRWSTLAGTSLRLVAAATSQENLELMRQLLARKIRNRQPHARSLFSRRLAQLPCFGSDLPLLRSRDHLTNTMSADHASLLLPYLLHFGDAISMGHSIESRLPFLDHRLVEFVHALPFHQKIRGRQFKYILRREFDSALPVQILARRRKVGFDTPIGNWLRSIFSSEIKPLLSSSRLQQRDLFDEEALATRLSAFEMRGEGAGLILRCMAVELWFRLFIDGEGFRE